MQLADHTFLITGGASGLGAACATLLVAAGANVSIADVNETAGRELADELGRQAQFVRMDVTDDSSVRQGLLAAQTAFGRIYGLIGCAGILGASRVVGKDGPHDLALFRRVIEINLVGTFNVIRLAAAAMAQNVPNDDGERGVIINTASVAAYEGQIGQAAYSASKGAIASMTLPIARELARFGIRVMTIAPGVFATPMVTALSVDAQQSLAAQAPFPSRAGRPSEFAALARHIIENAMLNGEVIRLDGAMRMAAK